MRMTFCAVESCLCGDEVHYLTVTFSACVLPVAAELPRFTPRDPELLPLTSLFPRQKALQQQGSSWQPWVCLG